MNFFAAILLINQHLWMITTTNTTTTIIIFFFSSSQIGSRTNIGRPLILIDAGIHAREWIAPASAIFLIHELVKRFDSNQTDQSNESSVLKFDWIVIPTLNPDGYIHTFLRNRMWRKNR